jgi:hypothetical protein
VSRSDSWLRLLADSPISDFTTTPQRVGANINASRCSWILLVSSMLRANIPIWLYWRIPPTFMRPLINEALNFAPLALIPNFVPVPLHCRLLPRLSVRLPTPSQSDSLPTPSLSDGLPTPSQSVSLRSGQLRGESWKDFIIRQNQRKKGETFNRERC